MHVITGTEYVNIHSQLDEVLSISFELLILVFVTEESEFRSLRVNCSLKSKFIGFKIYS